MSAPRQAGERERNTTKVGKFRSTVPLFYNFLKKYSYISLSRIHVVKKQKQKSFYIEHVYMCTCNTYIVHYPVQFL